MDILASLIKLVFGSKADKDRKQIEPYIEKIKYSSVHKAIQPSIGLPKSWWIAVSLCSVSEIRHA